MYNSINIHTDNASSRAGADWVVMCNIINTSSIRTQK